LKIMVTGSTGFIGGALSKALLAQGHTVVAFHRPNSPQTLLEGLGVEHVLGDLTHPETLLAAMQGVEVVFHTAAHMTGGRDNAGRLYTVTVEGTRGLMQAARQAGVRRVVHTSSVAALGVPDRRGVTAPLTEAHTWNYPPQAWHYGYAKYLAELEVQRAVAQGLDAVIVNPSVVLGAGDLYRQTDSIVVQTARHRLPALTESGLNAIHIDDVVDGHLAALERGRCGERYILGGHNLTLVQFIRTIASLTGVIPPALVLDARLTRLISIPLGWIEPILDLPVELSTLRLAGYYFYYDTSKATKELGLAPARPLGAAITEAYDWFSGRGVVPPRPMLA
jgi:dihydroflavonol-4-reductase